MSNTYLPSKPRYEILDGLRGVAALIVVAFHLCETYSTCPADMQLNHGYLAVDFFFVLSGFVIGYAYDDRWNRMTTWGFFKRRLVRLHPMVVMGTLIGGALYYFGDSPAFPLMAETPWWMMLAMVVLGCLMIPAPTQWDIRGWAETNSLNGPIWSLTFEYIANILYALVIRHFSKITLGIFVALSACLTLDITFNIDFFGLLEGRTGAEHTLIGGWCITPQQIYIGFSRLLYPFFMGLLLSRVNRLIKVKRGFYWCALFTALLLVMPRVGGEGQAWMNGAYEALCVLVLFPIVVSMGAGSDITGKRSVALCQFLGKISYPLYITHFPWVYMHVAWVRSHPQASVGEHIILSVSIYLLALGIAYACMKLYDEPVREWLKQRFLVTKKA